MNQNITIIQVMNNDYSNLRNWLTNAINPYKSFYAQPNDYFDKYITFLFEKLKLSIDAKKNFACLYDLEDCKAMMQDLINDKIHKLMSDAMFSKLIVNPYWDDFENLGSNEASGTSTIGYEGYDVMNQQGQFQTNSTKMNNKGGSGRTNYLLLLNQTTTNFINDFVKNMVKLMCRIIY